MYDVSAFREQRVEVLHALMRAHPLATLVTLTASGLEANHIPLLIGAEPAPYGTLRGHVARANPLWRAVDARTEVLAVFQGPLGYISPSWYPSKKETGKVVPTWNYAVVHAHGPLVIHDDVEWLRDLVTRLTVSQESQREKPWQVTDAPADYIDTMLKAIVGIEIPITRLQGKWKMSQNRLPQDKAGVIANLQARGDAASRAMLDAMKP
ncbi:MAG: FMN-binding negative transcriptional regulator [Betaproteobacteria bacterium]|nr:FMN-binding negative transcriptional regulator [Betaproteobacteria bacterium]